jgi:hypothetical protein
MTYGQHLKRSRNGTLSFRFKFPADVAAVIGRTEFTIGLGTASKREAAPRAAELKSMMMAAVCAARAGPLTNPKVETFGTVAQLKVGANSDACLETQEGAVMPDAHIPPHFSVRPCLDLRHRAAHTSQAA